MVFGFPASALLERANLYLIRLMVVNCRHGGGLGGVFRVQHSADLFYEKPFGVGLSRALGLYCKETGRKLWFIRV